MIKNCIRLRTHIIEMHVQTVTLIYDGTIFRSTIRHCPSNANKRFPIRVRFRRRLAVNILRIRSSWHNLVAGVPFDHIR